MPEAQFGFRFLSLLARLLVRCLSPAGGLRVTVGGDLRESWRVGMMGKKRSRVRPV